MDENRINHLELFYTKAIFKVNIGKFFFSVVLLIGSLKPVQGPLFCERYRHVTPPSPPGDIVYFWGSRDLCMLMTPFSISILVLAHVYSYYWTDMLVLFTSYQTCPKLDSSTPLPFPS
jgi:hypothetical protein